MGTRLKFVWRACALACVGSSLAGLFLAAGENPVRVWIQSVGVVSFLAMLFLLPDMEAAYKAGR